MQFDCIKSNLRFLLPNSRLVNVMKAVFLLFGAAFLASYAIAGDLPQLQAEAVETVRPDNMGGCSMKCTFPWKVSVTRKGEAKKTRVIALNDNRFDTAWKDPAGGVGDKLTFYFPEQIPSDMEGKVPFYGLDLINGDLRSAAAWDASGRVKKVRMYYNDKPQYDITWADSKLWQHVSFGEYMVHSGDTVTLEILETYPGKSPTLAISEIVLQGAH